MRRVPPRAPRLRAPFLRGVPPRAPRLRALARCPLRRRRPSRPSQGRPTRRQISCEGYPLALPGCWLRSTSSGHDGDCPAAASTNAFYRCDSRPGLCPAAAIIAAGGDMCGYTLATSPCQILKQWIKIAARIYYLCVVPSPICFALRLWSENPQAAGVHIKTCVNAKCARPDPIPLSRLRRKACEGGVIPYEAEVMRFRSRATIAQPLTSPM